MRAHSPAGFTLIEVLVALFVLSVGLLGAAALQAKARAVQTGSIQRSAASLIAGSLAERMRANPVAMSAPDASNPYLHIDIDSGAAAAPAVQCFGAANCTPAELAAFDVNETSRALRAALPHARLRVCRDAAPWDAASASLLWDCDAGSGAPIVIKLGWPPRGAGQPGGFPPALILTVSGAGA